MSVFRIKVFVLKYKLVDSLIIVYIWKYLVMEGNSYNYMGDVMFRDFLYKNDWLF